MSTTTFLHHCIPPPRFLTAAPPHTSSVFELKGRLHPQLSPLLSTHHNLRYRLQRHNSRIASCISSSSSSSSSFSSSPSGTGLNPSTRLFVSGLSFRTSEESLRNAFRNFGDLVEVNLVMDKIANRPRGFAFLRYATEEESKKAIEGMHGKFLDGRVIFVEIAKPRKELRQGFRQNPEPS